MTDETPCCTCLSISRDPLCVYHGDIDKVAACSYTVADFKAQVMPNRPMHNCAEPRCPVLLPSGQARCPKHSSAQEHQRPNYDRRKLYRRAKWAHPVWGVRAHVLRRDAWTCAVCHRATLDPDVDHIRRPDTDAAFYDLAGLQTLCKSCHSTKTARGE